MPPNRKLESLTAAFINLRITGFGTTGQWGTNTANGGVYSVVSPNLGSLNLSVPAATASAIAQVWASGYWDITESYCLVNVVAAGAQASTVELWCPQLFDSQGTWFGWHIINGQIQANYGGTVVASATYSATTHAWLKIRETAGSTYFDYSSDGLNWTNLTSYADTAHPYGPQGVYPNFYLGTSGGQTTNPASAVVIDTFNLPPNPASIPTYATSDNLPAPVSTGTTVQSFTDVNGDVWIAKNGVYGGAWKRARDVLSAVLDNTAGYTTLVSPGGIVPYSTSPPPRDVYGCATGSPNYGLTAPIAGLYRVVASLVGTTTVANNYLQGQIQQTVLPSTTSNLTSDNMISQQASGNIGWRSHVTAYLGATDYVNVKLYQATAAAITTSVPLANRLEFAYVGTG